MGCEMSVWKTERKTLFLRVRTRDAVIAVVSSHVVRRLLCYPHSHARTGGRKGEQVIGSPPLWFALNPPLFLALLSMPSEITESARLKMLFF